MSDGTWGPDGPPEEAYNRVTDPERFRPLHAAADRLVADLVARYEVEVVPVDVAPEVARWAGGTERAVELRPPSGTGATVLLAWTGFPGVVVHAGHSYELVLPSCGCDACDEPLDWMVDELHRDIDGIAAGGLTESRHRRPLRRDRVEVELQYLGGHATSSGTIEADELQDRRLTIPVGTTDWDPWPRR